MNPNRPGRFPDKKITRGVTMNQAIEKTEAQKQASFDKNWNAFIERLTLTHMASLIKARKFSPAQIERAMVGAFSG
jgi:hypothetical protein